MWNLLIRCKKNKSLNSLLSQVYVQRSLKMETQQSMNFFREKVFSMRKPHRYFCSHQQAPNPMPSEKVELGMTWWPQEIEECRVWYLTHAWNLEARISLEQPVAKSKEGAVGMAALPGPQAMFSIDRWVLCGRIWVCVTVKRRYHQYHCLN